MTIDKKYFPQVIASLAWVVVSLVSIFTINTQLLGNVYTIISIVARLTLPLIGLVFIKKAYIDKSLTSLSYGHYQNIIGYSITLTYVLYMLPSVVSDYYDYNVNLGVFTVFVFLSAICPATLYLVIRSAKFKLESGFFKENEVKLNRKEKKKYKKGLKKYRNPLQNIWFEFFDPLLWAIILILVLNTFIFQHYQIPTSSMVNEFLEKDRVFSSKLLSGVQLPLTEYRLPEFSEIEVGEIVTFKNPKLDNPESDIYFNSLFSRIFHPFFFYLTFSTVDIDKKDNGEPKERELVKRVIGMPGEKLSMVNDKVYKKKPGEEWILMSEIPGEKEWGNADLFYIDNKNSGAQIINPSLREILDSAASKVNNSDPVELSKGLKINKDILLRKMEGDKTEVLRYIDYKISGLSSGVESLKRDLGMKYWNMVFLNVDDRLSIQEKKRFVERYNQDIVKYNQCVLLDMLEFSVAVLNIDYEEINKSLTTNVDIEGSFSPYDTFTIKLNSLIKLKKLEILNSILLEKDFSNELEILTSLLIYTRGYEFGDLNYDGREDNISFFGAGNLPEFPEEDSYIEDGEYFLMGDNRYNSSDSRMGDNTKDVWLTDDHSIFAEKVNVYWNPHSIHEKYIHGKIIYRGFPFNRIKLY